VALDRDGNGGSSGAPTLARATGPLPGVRGFRRTAARRPV